MRWKWPVLVTVLLFGLQLLVVGAARLYVPQGDPFAPYAIISAGQSTRFLQHYPCILVGQMPVQDVIASCQLPSPDGPIEAVTVTVNTPDGIIHALTFRVRDLYVGDLVLRWGRPPVVEDYHKSLMLRWPDGMSASINYARTYNYRSHVYAVTLNQQTQRPGTGGSLSPVGDVQLAQNHTGVPFDRALAEDKLVGNFPVG